MYEVHEVNGYVFVCQDIECAPLDDFSISFWNCSNSVVFYIFHFIITWYLYIINNTKHNVYDWL